MSIKAENIGELAAFTMESSDSGILITDPRGIIVYANPKLCALSGFEKGELLNQNARIFQSGKTPLSVYRKMWATILSGSSWQGELCNKRKDNELYWVKMHLSPVVGPDGSIVYFLAFQEEMTQEARLGPETHNIPYLDPLTGLLNRSAFVHSLEEVIRDQQDRPEKRAISVYYLDIDRFHSVNEQAGYPVGDRVLNNTAMRLAKCLRRSDTVARVGADVFATFLLEGEERVQDTNTLERILREIREPVTIDQQQLFITASIGCARCPACGTDPETVLDRARSAMKIAKGQGGDTYHIIGSEGQTADNDKNNLLSDLRHAIERQQLILYYQPQINLVSGEITGLEALLRWFRSPGEMVPPDQFIPIAEKSDIIISIGEWVLQQAITQIKSWHEQGLPWMKIAVNLSATHFHRRDLPSFVEKLILASGVAPQYLELELTEGAILRDPLRVKENIAHLKSLGVQISLDDFGTGHSSLVWLSQLPVDQVKIDKSFLADATVNPVNASIIAATIAMAQKLDKNVIAEGVETEAQLNFIRRHGCDFMQGFLFSKPRPVADITDMLRQNLKWSFKDFPEEKQNFTLLIVDDEPQILKMLKRIFHREGYTILSASNGEEALAILAENQAEIVISDHLMPGMTGVELLTTIKKLYPDTTRIILSGQADVSTIIDAINHGAIWKYFTKPLESDLLRTAVRKACQQIIVRENK